MTDVRHHAVQVPATTANLGPGFDAFGAAVGLHLYARSLPRDAQPERVATTGAGAGDDGDLPTGDENLLWRSLVAFCEHVGVEVPDVAVRVTTSIPLERGLGSSSSAIVAGLGLGRALTGAVVGDVELCELADRLEGHPDNVVPAILGGLTACTTDGDGRLVVRRVQPAPRLRPVVLVPQTRQSTSEARGVLPETLTRAEVAVETGRGAHVVGALAGLWPAEASATADLLHEPARLAVMEPTGAAVTALRAGGVHAWLSGAGPSVAAAVADLEADHHALLDAVATEHGMTVHRLDWDLRGLLACPDDGCGLAGVGGCAQCPREGVR
ncbi:MAG: homoserine kinase [Actinomycetes bacterium]